jgi:protein-S-isoprenylcysteine O-methyltransferase Ste14
MTSRRHMLLVAVLAWFVGMPLAHGALPWALSRLGPRLGWGSGGPAVWNDLGLVVVAAAVVVLLWVMITVFARLGDLPEVLALDWTPKILLVRGPYAYSRNPMYVGELLVWLGCAIYFGSPVVGAVFLCMWPVQRLLVGREERDLERKFGEEYRRYRARIPRWF